MDSKNEIRYRLRSRREGEGVDLRSTGEREFGCESVGMGDLLLVVVRAVLEGV